jgi:hypothetical protein
MCLMCQEEDLYFLYLERIEREKKAARGETAPPDANWLWRASSVAQPAEATDAASTQPRTTSRFTCDAPDGE